MGAEPISAPVLKGNTMTPAPAAVFPRPRRKEDLVYQAVTVAAMVTLLVSVWIF